MNQRRLHTMTAGDIESVLSGHPRRRLRPHTIGGAWTDADQILLCTDGFARLVSDYTLYPDWRQVVTSVDIVDTWVYEITPVRHVFIVSYGTRYTGDEGLTYSDERKELGLFPYAEVAGLHMPEPYKITINRWRQRIGAGGQPASRRLPDP